MIGIANDTCLVWPVSSLKRFGILLGGSGFPIDEQGFSEEEMELPFFKVKDLAGSLTLTETNNYISKETAIRLGATIFPESTIVFAKVGAALLLNRFRVLGCKGCLDNNMMAFLLEKPHDVGFFQHLLNASDLSSNFNQGPVPSVNTRQVGALNVTVPTPFEQHKIAVYLDASCAAIDAAVSAKRRQLATLVALRKSIIQRAVTRGIAPKVVLEATGNVWLAQIPRGWKLVALKRIAEIRGGLTLGKHYEGELIERPYLRVGNVQDGHLDLADVSVIELPASVAAGVELCPDDVLMTEGGDLDKLGRGHLWRGEIPGCLHQNHIFAVRCFAHKLKPLFLAYATAAQYGRDYFEATGKKTTNLANTNATKVGQFPIPLPPLAEQEAICAHLDEKTAEVNRITATITAQIETLTAYRKSLIHECVTGQRRVTDADLRALA